MMLPICVGLMELIKEMFAANGRDIDLNNYKYATGLSIASYIAENIINKTLGFREKYIEFLKASGRDYPLEVLKIIDVDLTDTKVFDEAMHVFRKTLDEFIELSK